MAVIATLRRWLRARRERKLEQVDRDYGNMTAKERFDLDRLRDEHRPSRGGDFGAPYYLHAPSPRHRPG